MEKKQVIVHGFEEFDYDKIECLKEICAKVAHIETADDMVDNFFMIDNLLNFNDNFNWFPLTSQVFNVIYTEHNYMLFGKWVIVYNMTAENYEKLDSVNQVPYYGYDYKYSDFL